MSLQPLETAKLSLQPLETAKLSLQPLETAKLSLQPLETAKLSLQSLETAKLLHKFADLECTNDTELYALMYIHFTQRYPSDFRDSYPDSKNTCNPSFNRNYIFLMFCTYFKNLEL